MIDERPLEFDPLNESEITEIMENSREFSSCDLLMEAGEIYVQLQTENNIMNLIH